MTTCLLLMKPIKIDHDYPEQCANRSCQKGSSQGAGSSDVRSLGQDETISPIDRHETIHGKKQWQVGENVTRHMFYFGY